MSDKLRLWGAGRVQAEHRLDQSVHSPAFQHAQHTQHTHAHTGVVEEVEGIDDGSSAAHWARPVRCRVGGGFTISRLAEASGGADSPECLVTLVLNVSDFVVCVVCAVSIV